MHELLGAYAAYSIVQLCHQAREGYAGVYINDVELERARSASKALEKAAIAKDPTLEKDLDRMFVDADRYARKKFSELGATSLRYWCQSALDELLHATAAGPYHTRRP